MNIFELLEQWRDGGTRIELHYIEMGKRHRTTGRIDAFHSEQQQVRFRHEMNHREEIISLSQIEDAIVLPALSSDPASQVSATRQSESNRERSDGGKAGEASSASSSDSGQSRDGGMHTDGELSGRSAAKQDKKNPDLKEEMVMLLDELHASDLYALFYPVVKHLAREREKRTLVSR